MSAKRFEDQVRESMEELKYSPSENVWAGVVTELDKRRKRRVALWWIPMGFLLVGSVYFGTQWKINGTNTLSEKEQQQNSLTGQKENLSIKSFEENPEMPGRSSSENNPREPKNSNAIVIEEDANISVDKATKNISANRTNKNSKSNIAYGINSNSNKTVFESSVEESGNNLKVSGVTNEESQLKIDKSNVITDNPVDNPEQSLESSTLKFYPETLFSFNEIKSSLPLKDYNLSTASPSKPILRNWSYGLNVSTGLAGIYDRNLIKQTDASVGSFNAFLPGNLSGTVYRTGVVEPGLFFAIGGFIERPVGKLFNLSAGLNYTRYNTNVNVGAKISQSMVIFPGTQDNQSISSYYSPDPKSTYQMHHSMIEIPVTVRFTYKSLSANAGLTGSTLVSSDMLAFDARSGVYYKEKDKINRFQFGLTGGFDVRVLKKAKYPLHIGPVIRYQVSDITSRYSDSRHLISAAMQARFYLQR